MGGVAGDLGMAGGVMLMSGADMLVGEIPTDIKADINLLTSLDVVRDIYGSEEDEIIPIIEDNKVVETLPVVKQYDDMRLSFNWSLADDFEVKAGDYFKIDMGTLPVLFDFNYSTIKGEEAGDGFYNLYKDNDNNPDNEIVNKPENLLGKWKIENGNIIHFIADENIEDLDNRSGYFWFIGEYDEATTIDSFTIENITVGDLTVSYVPDDATVSGGILQDYRLIGGSELNKSGVAEETSSTINWNISYGYEALAKIANGETVELSENVVIIDNLEQQTKGGNDHLLKVQNETTKYVYINMRTHIFRPTQHNGSDELQMSATAALTLSVGEQLLRINEFSDGYDFENKKDWINYMKKSDVPCIGISDDLKTLIINLGDIGNNGITYAKSNEALEKLLVDEGAKAWDQRFHPDEIVYMMQTFGFNDGYKILDPANDNAKNYRAALEATIEAGTQEGASATAKTNAANAQICLDALVKYQSGELATVSDNKINGQAMTYSFGFASEGEPGETYNNTATLYKKGDSKDGIDSTVEGIKIAEAGGGITGETTKNNGKITLTKVDSVEQNTKLEGATFQLFVEENGEFVPVLNAKGEAKIKTTPKNGKVEFQNLEAGTYAIAEIKAPEGYDISTFEFRNNGGNWSPVDGGVDVDGVNYKAFQVVLDFENGKEHNSEYKSVVLNTKTTDNTDEGDEEDGGDDPVGEDPDGGDPDPKKDPEPEIEEIEIPIEDEETPLGDLEEEIEIIDEEVVLGSIPEEELVILDDDIPLGALPQTSDDSNLTLYLFSSMILSALALVVTFTKKTKA